MRFCTLIACVAVIFAAVEAIALHRAYQSIDKYLYAMSDTVSVR